MRFPALNFRLVIVCVAAAAVGLPIAIISIAKALLLFGSIALLIFSSKFVLLEAPPYKLPYTRLAISVSMIIFGASIAWTNAPILDALGSWGKYGKLLFIPLIAALVQTRREALIALVFFSGSQLFLAISSWLLFFHLAVPWATSRSAAVYSSVFSSYLDQGIMTAVFASVCWQLRTLVPGRFGRYAAIAVAVIALLNVFFVLRGRTGHAVALILISLAILYELPARYRGGIAGVPILLLAAALAFLPQIQDRALQVKSEVQGFFAGEGGSVVTGTSSGIRLHFWHRALQSMSEHPLLGAGVGSWSNEFIRLEKEKSSKPEIIRPMGNPHQEYLLWGVQLGMVGVFLFFWLLISIFRDTRTIDETSARAVRSVLAGFAVSCLFNSTLYDAQIGDFFCVALGLLMALGIAERKNQANALATNEAPSR